MIVLYCIVAFIAAYLFLCRSGGIARHIMVLLAIAIVTPVMQAVTLDFLMPFGGFTVDMWNARIILAVGVWPAVAAPPLGMLAAKFVRDKASPQAG